jgi:hypothetical protein
MIWLVGGRGIGSSERRDECGCWAEIDYGSGCEMGNELQLSDWPVRQSQRRAPGGYTRCRSQDCRLMTMAERAVAEKK